jgi:hypothetical protein
VQRHSGAGTARRTHAVRRHSAFPQMGAGALAGTQQMARGFLLEQIAPASLLPTTTPPRPDCCDTIF